MSSTLLWLTLLFFFISITYIFNLGSGLVSIFGVMSILFISGLFYIYWGFNNKRIWAYRLAIGHWLFLILVCSLIAILDLIRGIGGDIISLIMSGMLFFISIGMVKRFKTFTNPLFIAWYFADSQHLLASAQLNDGEMMGACPHCWSILAIKPLELNTEDKCPQCGGMLVSEETAKQFSDEEE